MKFSLDEFAPPGPHDVFLYPSDSTSHTPSDFSTGEGGDNLPGWVNLENTKKIKTEAQEKYELNATHLFRLHCIFSSWSSIST